MNTVKSRAAILTAARGAVEVQSLFVCEPGPGEVLLRMEACGICHSDLFVSSLEKLPVVPVTLGHEGIARVEAVGPGVTGFAPGERAGMTFLATTCGTCDLCRSGRERFCAKQTNFGYTLHGALTDYAIAPAAALVRVPDDLPARTAAPLCCAGWTAYGGLQQAGLERGQTVALFGLGGLGHLALQMARLRGLRIAAVDVSDAKLEMARANGADLTAPADAAGKTLQKQIGGVDAAIVFTPSPAAIQQAFKSLKRNGTLVMVGISVNTYELPLVDTIVKGIQMRGSYLGTRQELADVFELARTGAIRPHVETHSIEETPELLEKLRRGEITGRAVIAF
jgi:propanol-preferring alcohol dehydrogenase